MEFSNAVSGPTAKVFQAYTEIHNYLQGENNRLTDVISERDRELKQLKNKLENQALELSIAQNKITEYEEQIINLTNEKQRQVQMEAEIGTSKDRVRKLQASLDMSAQKASSFELQVDEKNRQLQTLNDDFAKFLRAQTPNDKEPPVSNEVSVEDNWKQIKNLLRQQFQVSVNAGSKLVAQGRKWMGVLPKLGTSNIVNAVTSPGMKVVLPETATQIGKPHFNPNIKNRYFPVDDDIQIIETPGESGETLVAANEALTMEVVLPKPTDRKMVPAFSPSIMERSFPVDDDDIQIIEYPGESNELFSAEKEAQQYTVWINGSKDQVKSQQVSLAECQLKTKTLEQDVGKGNHQLFYAHRQLTSCRIELEPSQNNNQAWIHGYKESEKQKDAMEVMETEVNQTDVSDDMDENNSNFERGQLETIPNANKRSHSDNQIQNRDIQAFTIGSAQPVLDDKLNTALSNLYKQLKRITDFPSTYTPNFHALYKTLEKGVSTKRPFQCPFFPFEPANLKTHTITVHPEKFLVGVKYSGVSISNFKQYCQQLINHSRQNCVSVAGSASVLKCGLCQYSTSLHSIKQHLLTSHFPYLIEKLTQLQIQFGYHNDRSSASGTQLEALKQTASEATGEIVEAWESQWARKKFEELWKNLQTGSRIKCYFCTLEYPKKHTAQYLAHLGDHHAQNLYSFVVLEVPCGGQKFSAIWQTVFEVERVQDQAEPPLGCQHCSCQFVRPGYLKLHLILYHADILNKYIENACQTRDHLQRINMATVNEPAVDIAETGVDSRLRSTTPVENSERELSAKLPVEAAPTSEVRFCYEVYEESEENDNAVHLGEIVFNLEDLNPGDTMA